MPEPAKPTKEQALANLQAQEEAALKLTGKQGFNPHFFIEREVKPARFLVSNEPTEANIARAMAVKFDEKKADASAIVAKEEHVIAYKKSAAGV